MTLTAAALGNPYLTAFLNDEPAPPGWTRGRRLYFCDRYAFAIPDASALDLIAAHSPQGLVELGAGNGYWARLLHDRGVDVRALEPFPNRRRTTWHPLVRAGHRGIGAYPRRTLLICWPSQDQPWAHDALRRFRGDTVIYVGLPRTGGDDARCATPEFFDELDRWDETALHYVPQWPGQPDALSVHQR